MCCLFLRASPALPKQAPTYFGFLHAAINRLFYCFSVLEDSLSVHGELAEHNTIHLQAKQYKRAPMIKYNVLLWQKEKRRLENACT